jgi:uncharacterized protein involved in exopolysaccharide biosynthesis
MTADSTHRRPGTIGDYRDLVRRRGPIAFTAFLALAAGSVAAVLMARPFYDGELKLLVKHDRIDSVVTSGPGADASRTALSEHDVMSQAELLRSDDLLERVASESGLAAQLLASGKAASDAEALAAAADTLRDSLRVTAIKRTWLIDVRYRANDRHTVKHVLDTLARLYLQKHLTLHRPSGISTFFVAQADQARQDLQAAQDRLVNFGLKNGVVSASLERDNVLQKFVEFDALRAQAAAAHLETTRRLSAVRKELQSVPARQVAEVRTADDAGATRDIRAHILTLETRRTELLRKFTPQYRGVQETDEQLREARASLAAAQQVALTEQTVAPHPAREWLDTERARIVAERAAAHARMQAFASTADHYRNRAQLLDLRNAEEHDLVLDLQSAEQKYLLYAQKAEEARISDELDRMRVANVVVAQAPTVSHEATRNPSLATLPILLAISLFLSFGVAVACDVLDPSVRYAAAEQAPRAALYREAELETIEPQIRVRAVEVAVNVAKAAEHVARRDRYDNCDTVIPMPAPARARSPKPVTLEDIFGLTPPRRLRP